MYNILKIIGVLLITIFHIGICVFKGNPFLHYLAFYGLNLFVFVSGYGICSSLNKPTKYFDFIKKRFSKLALPYYIALLMYVLLEYFSRGNFHLKSTLAHVFLISNLFRDTWRPSSHLWFISMIMQLYLVAPFIRKWIKKDFVLTFIISCVLYLVYKKLGLCHRSPLRYLFVFVLGMFAKQQTNFKRETNKVLIWIGGFTYYIYLANFIFTYSFFWELIVKELTMSDMFICFLPIIAMAFFIKLLTKKMKKL